MNTPVDVVIIGGGIAGLSAGWHAQQAGLSCVILEAGERWGGKVHTAMLEVGHTESLRVEYAPDGFITRKPGMMALVRSLGIEDALLPVNNTPERIYVLTGGKLHPLPDGLHLLAPTKFLPFLRSGLFSWRGKLRILCEPFIPPRKDSSDESLAEFVTRRLGREALHKLGEPLLAGVYNADPHRQSIMATFGNFRKIEAEHGSLIRGLRRLVRRDNTTPALMSFKGGMGALTSALVARLTAQMHLNTPAQRIQHDGHHYTVSTSGGDFRAPHIVFATPTTVTADLLANIAPQASAELAQIRYTGVGSVSLAYRIEDIPRPMNAYGVVIPGTERRNIDGITWTSAKWMHRTPDRIGLIRVFFGGIHTSHTLELSQDERLQIVRQELANIMGITAEPLAHHEAIWRDGYPQYDVGHAERVARIQAALPAGVAITGNAYYGVGLPDTVSTSQRIIEIIGEGRHANHTI